MRSVALIPACVVLLSGCNGILGIEDASLDPWLSEAGAGDAGSVPRDGDPCSTVGNLVCGLSASGSSDRAALYCDGTALEQVFECTAPDACINGASGSFVACGTPSNNLPVANTGAPCGALQSAACSFDQATVLECEGGTWTPTRRCAPSRCATVVSMGQTTLACENGGYSPGDRCGFAAGRVVCSTDLRSVLDCQGGRTTVVETCSASSTCRALADGSIGCR